MTQYLKNGKEMRVNLRLLLHGCLYGFLLVLAVNGTAALARSPKAAVPEYCAEDMNAPLIPELGRDQLLRLKKILHGHGNPNECFSGMSPLMWAIDANDPEIVRQFLDAGAHPDRPRPAYVNVTPLSMALSTRSYGISLLLLERGANARHVDKLDKQTVLHEMAFGPRKIADQPEELEIAQIVRKAGISVNARNAIGMTPIYLATSTADQSLVTWLLYQGADPKLKDHKNRDAFSAAHDREGESAADIRKKEQILLMLETEPLARLLRQGKTAEFERSFKRCAPEKTARHATALLMTAVEYGQREAARTLIRCGGKADETGFVLRRLAEKDRFGEPKLAAARMTPLALAALKGDEAMTAVLRVSGVK